MKWCCVAGDLTSEVDIEQFPNIALCDECVAAIQQAALIDPNPDNWIGDVSAADPEFDTCESCGKTVEMEELENQLKDRDVDA